MLKTRDTASAYFLLSRETDAYAFKPNEETDAVFGKALRYATERGVEAYAYSSEFKMDRMALKGRVKVMLLHLK